LKSLISRIFLSLLITAAAAMLLFGPRPSASEPAGRTVIQYWDKWTGLEGQQAKQVVDAFNATVGKDKNIWVNYVSMSQIDRKTLISTAAGAPPDVAGLWDSQVLEFASMNALEPLDDYAAQAGLTRDHYKHVYYDGCQYKGTLYALPSTVWCVALMWNKEVFQQKATELRAAGLDPDRAPRTIQELDKYAAVIDSWQTVNGRKHLQVAGYIPLEPGSFTNYYPYWFGSNITSLDGTRMLLNTPQVKACYDWIRGYSERLGKEEIAEFRSGFNSGGTNLYDTPQNPFLVGWISMEQQGPWSAAFIEKLKPSMNRWHVPADQLQREKDFENVNVGMSVEDVQKLLGIPGDAASNGLSSPPPAPENGHMLHWLAGIKDLYITFVDDKVTAKQFKLLPAKLRQQYCQLGCAPFPSAVPGLENVTYAGMDVWAIPSTSHHKKEAFEFLSFASRRQQIERLSSLHCNLSPLAQESDEYLENHPNAYVGVYEALAASPNALPLPRAITWPQTLDELEQVAERSYMLQATTVQILQEAQQRCQKELNQALGVPDDTNLTASVDNKAP
jgi:ABC-type glycerol-3-phosphate transport system substrate-binding protein